MQDAHKTTEMYDPCIYAGHADFFRTKKGVPQELVHACTPLAESHTHLTCLRHIDPALALARACVAGVRYVVTVVDPCDDAQDVDALLADLSSWESECRDIVDYWSASGVRDVLGDVLKTPCVRFLAGCHPHHAQAFDDAARERLRILLAHERCCGVGEIGLDYHYDYSPRDVQRRVFLEQMQLACELCASVSLHIREAHDDAYTILQTSGLPRKAVSKSANTAQPGCVLHCFDLGPEVAQPFLEMGCVLGIGGAVTFKSNDAVREVVRAVEPGRIVFETDAPYMSPEPLRGTRCEPAYIALSARYVAQLRQESGVQSAESTYRDAYELCLRIFDRPAPLCCATPPVFEA